MLSQYSLERLERLTVMYDILDKKSMSKISGYTIATQTATGVVQDENTLKEDCKVLLLENIKKILSNAK